MPSPDQSEHPSMNLGCTESMLSFHEVLRLYILLCNPAYCRDCLTGVEMCEVVAGPGGAQVSFNPLNWKQLCLVGPSRVVLWTLEQCDTQELLSPV